MAVKMKDTTKSTTDIQCPYCKTEYTPEQIFIPKYIFDEDQKEEMFNCENCNKDFLVALEIKYTVKPMDNTFLISKNNIKLDLEYDNRRKENN